MDAPKQAQDRDAARRPLDEAPRDPMGGLLRIARFEVRVRTNDPSNVLAGAFAVALCLVNALTWAFVSGVPLMGIAWVGMAIVCVRLQAWSRS
jgi:hypothetical protein